MTEFLIDRNFVQALLFLLLGLFLGACSGKYFYDERYGVAAGLIGGGCLCGVIAWFFVMPGSLL